MTSALAEQQRTLLTTLWMPQRESVFAALASSRALDATPSWQRGIDAYRSNACALAERALSGAYPVVAQLLGTDNFRALSRDLWRHAPPMRGDVGCWGDNFAGQLERTPGLMDAQPYLPDVARVEWCRHEAARAADGVADIASLQLLVEHDPSHITLVLAAGTACIASAYAVASIVNAHLEGTPSMEQAADRLRGKVAETAVIWRSGFKPCVREALAAEPQFIAALQERHSLADSLDSADGLDFNTWLATALHSGLLLRAELA